MTRTGICSIARRLMLHPAAPYNEHAVRQEVEKICKEHSLDFEHDTFGNVLAKLQRAGRARDLVLAAHLDHPGFEVIQLLADGSVLVRFLGGVADNYFRCGVPIRLMPGNIAARLWRRKDGERIFEAKLSGADESGGIRRTPNASRIPKGVLPREAFGVRGTPALSIRPTSPTLTLPKFAVWELEDFAVRHGRIHGRACDDLIGVAAILATLIELKRTRARVNVIGVISRAEEVGLQGALNLAAARGVPANSLVVSLETSRELPGVKMGEGVIIRVGDRTSIFDPSATRFLIEIARELKKTRGGFPFQRGLMSGGTCEATAYQEFGFQTAALCVALGNYHNCAERNRIKEEFVAVHDVCGMVDLLVAAAHQMGHYNEVTGRLAQRLRKLLAEGRARLKATAR
ncbi:MAG: hypothetical protein C5B50_06560 [Verrucomicrobia bacterium]|nr:MAG: hypothetical protein C5B50_06560 [Verrucomicrobiota bacterium]